MTIEDVKIFLRQVKLYDTLTNNKLEELQALEDKVTKITASLGGEVVSGSRSQDKLGDAVARIVDLEREIKEDLDIYKLAKKQIIDVVDKLTDPEQVDVLYKLYFFDKSWGDIAEEMHMSERNAQYIHGRALQSVLAIMTGERKNDGREDHKCYQHPESGRRF